MHIPNVIKRGGTPRKGMNLEAIGIRTPNPETAKIINMAAIWIGRLYNVRASAEHDCPLSSSAAIKKESFNFK